MSKTHVMTVKAWMVSLLVERWVKDHPEFSGAKIESDFSVDYNDAFTGDMDIFEVYNDDDDEKAGES